MTKDALARACWDRWKAMPYDEQLAEAAQLFHLAIQRNEIVEKLRKAKHNPKFWRPILP